MTIEEFKLRLKEEGLVAKKRAKLEVFDIHGDTNVYRPVYYTEIHPLLSQADIKALLEDKRIEE